MQSFGRREAHLLLMVFGIILILAASAKSTPVTRKSEKVFFLNISPPPQTFKAFLITFYVGSQLTPELSFQVKLHAFLLWASIGFLMPVGILIIRISGRVQCGRKLKILFYSHVILQMSAVLLATGAAILSIMKFDNSFSNAHQRLGIGLYGLILAQPLISFLRPHRGSKLRSIWYTAHWLLGTAISIIGIINIYLGLHVYDKKTSKNLKIWNLFFTFQVVMIAFIYLLQDRWVYIKKQGEILGNEQIAPSDIQIIASPEHSYRKHLPSLV